VETIEVADLELLERKYLQLSDGIKKLRLQIGNKDKSELDFFRYLKPLKKELSPHVKKLIRLKFKAAVKKFIKISNQGTDNLPNALIALQGIMKERRRKHRELLDLQRKNTALYLFEKSPLSYNNSQDPNVLPHQLQNIMSGDTGVTGLDQRYPQPVEDVASEQRQNVDKLLGMVEQQNGKLLILEQRFKNEFTEIKNNLKKIRGHQKKKMGILNDSDREKKASIANIAAMQS